MTVKAKLIVRLLAENTVVAESNDERLWQSTFAAITAGQSPSTQSPAPEILTPQRPPPHGRSAATGVNGEVAAFARDLGVDVDALIGACNPTKAAPFIALDHKTWEAFKRNTPNRGPKSIAPITLAGTLLALWAKNGGIAQPTVSQAQGVLATINLRDANAARGIRHSGCLQLRGNGIALNPSQISHAIRIAKAYCSKTPIEEAQS